MVISRNDNGTPKRYIHEVRSPETPMFTWEGFLSRRLLNLRNICKDAGKELYPLTPTAGPERSPFQKLEIADHWREGNGRLIVRRSLEGYLPIALSLKCAASSFIRGDHPDPAHWFITGEEKLSHSKY
jgi:hypothetical protein